MSFANNMKVNKLVNSLVSCRRFSSKKVSDVYIVSCARTPLGSFQGKYGNRINERHPFPPPQIISNDQLVLLG